MVVALRPTRVAFALAVCALSGCLSSPPQSTVDGGPIDGGTIDAPGGDASGGDAGVPCGTAASLSIPLSATLPAVLASFDDLVATESLAAGSEGLIFQASVTAATAIRSREYVRLHGSVVETGPIVLDGETFTLALEADSGDWVEMVVSPTLLSMSVNDVSMVYSFVPKPAAISLRMIVSATDVTFFADHTGGGFEMVGTLPLTFDALVRLSLSIEPQAGLPTTTVAALNPADVAPRCAASTLSDTFDEATLSPELRSGSSTTGCLVGPVGGALVLDHPGVPASCVASSARHFDLEAGAVVAEIDQVAPAAAPTTELQVVLHGISTETLMLHQIGDGSGGSLLACERSTDGIVVTNGAKIPFDAQAQRFWRLRALDGSSVACEYSADGLAYTSFGALNPGGSLADVELRLASEQTAPIATKVSFASLNP